jgi:hypothetical protein
MVTAEAKLGKSHRNRPQATGGGERAIPEAPPQGRDDEDRFRHVVGREGMLRPVERQGDAFARHAGARTAAPYFHRVDDQQKHYRSGEMAQDKTEFDGPPPSCRPVKNMGVYGIERDIAVSGKSGKDVGGKRVGGAKSAEERGRTLIAPGNEKTSRQRDAERRQAGEGPGQPA